MTQSLALTREQVVRRGKRLEYFTLAYNSVEAIVSLAAGMIAGSISLVGFGLDSVIEVASGSTLLWRLSHDADRGKRERAERMALKLVGLSFLALALYVAADSAHALITREAPDKSIAGIAITAISVLIMPVLARAKRRVSADMGSSAMQADAKQTDFCAYLSAITLGGLLLNAWLKWWWADPAAALLMVPIIGWEGIQSLKGKACECSGTCH